jgi:hypothetical protein
VERGFSMKNCDLQVNVILESNTQMKYFTDMKLVFDALKGRQNEFKWLLTDIELGDYPEEIKNILEWMLAV